MCLPLPPLPNKESRDKAVLGSGALEMLRAGSGPDTVSLTNRRAELILHILLIQPTVSPSQSSRTQSVLQCLQTTAHLHTSWPSAQLKVVGLVGDIPLDPAKPPSPAPIRPSIRRDLALQGRCLSPPPGIMRICLPQVFVTALSVPPNHRDRRRDVNMEGIEGS